MPGMRRRWLAAVLLAGIVAAGCASGTPGRPGGSIPAPTSASAASGSDPATIEHVVVIVMENHEYGRIIGSPQAPYLNRLARRNVLLTHEYAIRHPSLPNYLALTAGSTFKISSDCTSCRVKARNLVDQLEAHGISWRAYMESMPSPCFTGATAGTAPNDYAKKHDPFMYYDDIRKRPRRCRQVVPLRRLARNLQAGTLPRFAWITPNECHDMHSCGVATGDTWLKRWVPQLLPALGSNGILLVVFDEGSSNAGCCSIPGGGHVAAIIAGPGAGHGIRIRTALDHYSLLRLIEDAWGLRHLRRAGDAVTPTVTGWSSG